MRHRPETAIKHLVRARLKDVHTSVPAKVISYDQDTQTISAQPLVKRRIYNRVTRERRYASAPVIPKVPVAFDAWDSGAGSFTFPLSPGDRVYLIFSESPLDEWAAAQNDKPQEPFAARKFNYSDAIAIPGPQPPSQPLPASAVHADHPVLSCSEFLVGDSTADKALALAEAVAAQLNNLINLFNVHTHVSNVPGSPAGPATPQLPSVTPSDFASDVLKTNDGFTPPEFDPIPDPPDEPEAPEE